MGDHRVTDHCDHPYRITFVVERLPTIVSNSRQHWGARNRETKEWDSLVFFLTAGKRPRKPLARAKLKLLRASSRQADYEGITVSFKHVVDAMVSCGILKDDNYGVIGAPQFSWMPAPQKKGFIVVTVEEC